MSITTFHLFISYVFQSSLNSTNFTAFHVVIFFHVALLNCKEPIILHAKYSYRCENLNKYFFIIKKDVQIQCIYMFADVKIIVTFNTNPDREGELSVSRCVFILMARKSEFIKR